MNDGSVFFVIFATFVALVFIVHFYIKWDNEEEKKIKRLNQLKKEEKERRESKKIAEEVRNDREEKEQKEAKRIAEQKLAQLKKYDKALTFSTYELAEVVIGVVALSNFDKLKEVASVLSDQMHVDEVIVEASKKLSSGYESAIKEITGTRCMDIDYSEREVVAKLESLVDSCIAIGTGAIGKKIGHSAVSTGSSSSKGEIRNTKKWKE